MMYVRDRQCCPLSLSRRHPRPNSSSSSFSKRSYAVSIQAFGRLRFSRSSSLMTERRTGDDMIRMMLLAWRAGHEPALRAAQDPPT
jgi:hypothetical protein